MSLFFAELRKVWGSRVFAAHIGGLDGRKGEVEVRMFPFPEHR